nr:MAG TPA: hypothetical protein [Caudoviricetes sp.]
MKFFRKCLSFSDTFFIYSLLFIYKSITCYIFNNYCYLIFIVI